MTHPRTLEACVTHALTLNHASYTSHWAALTVRTQWGSLPADSRRRLLTMITAATQMASHAVHDDVWEQLAAWGQQHLDAPTSGVLSLEGPLLPSAVRAVLTGSAADEATEHVWTDLAKAWPDLMTATHQAILIELSHYDDPHLAIYAPADPQATQRVIRYLARIGRSPQARQLKEIRRADTDTRHLHA